MFKLVFQPRAQSDLKNLQANTALVKRFKAVRKALGLLENNPRHPGLNTHKYYGLTGPHGQDVFEAYAENNTPAAYRIFWCYGPEKSEITILSITPHP